MSLSTQTLKRLPKIKHGLIKGLNRVQIGDKCGVTEKTIDRDMQSWVQSGLFEIWIKEEFVRLHPKALKKDLMEVYKEICKLVGKTIIRKAEIKKEIKTERRTDIHILMERYEGIVKRAASRNMANLKRDDTEQQIHSSHTNT